MGHRLRASKKSHDTQVFHSASRDGAYAVILKAA